MIRFEIDRALFGMSEARRHLIQADPQAQFAISRFGEAEALRRAPRGKATVAAR